MPGACPSSAMGASTPGLNGGPPNWRLPVTGWVRRQRPAGRAWAAKCFDLQRLVRLRSWACRFADVLADAVVPRSGWWWRRARSGPRSEPPAAASVPLQSPAQRCSTWAPGRQAVPLEGPADCWLARLMRPGGQPDAPRLRAVPEAGLCRLPNEPACPAVAPAVLAGSWPGLGRVGRVSCGPSLSCVVACGPVVPSASSGIVLRSPAISFWVHRPVSPNPRPAAPGSAADSLSAMSRTHQMMVPQPRSNCTGPMPGSGYGRIDSCGQQASVQADHSRGDLRNSTKPASP